MRYTNIYFLLARKFLLRKASISNYRTAFHMRKYKNTVTLGRFTKDQLLANEMVNPSAEYIILFCINKFVSKATFDFCKVVFKPRVLKYCIFLYCSYTYSSSLSIASHFLQFHSNNVWYFIYIRTYIEEDLFFV